MIRHNSTARTILIVVLFILIIFPGYARADYFLSGGFFSSEANIRKLPLEVSSIAFGPEDRLCLLDKREGKIQIYSSKGLLIREFKSNADAITIDPWGYLYTVTDGINVEVFDKDGNSVRKILLESKEPRYEFISYSGFLSVDERGYIYIVSASSGKVSVYSPSGVYAGDLIKSGYGASDLTMVSAVTIDSKGNIYVAGNLPRITANRFEPNLVVVKKLSYQGYADTVFGPLTNIFVGGMVVDDLGNLYLLDTSSCNIYKFDKRGAMVTSFFAGRGASCLAIRSDGYLAIGYGGEIRLFHPSRLMNFIDKANKALLDGEYDTAINYWNEALRLNNYLKFIHSGLGETYLYMKDYRNALGEFKLAEDRTRYSSTIVLYRKEIFYRYILLWGILFLVILNAIILWGKKLFFLFDNIIGRMLYSPVRALAEVKKRDILLGVILIVSLALIDALNRRFVNYIFQPTLEDINYIFLRRLLMFSGLWLVSGTVFYGIGEIFDGMGTWKQCMLTTVMCFVPYIIFSLPLSLISNLLTFQEKVYYDYAQQGLMLWCVVLFFVNVYTTQQLSAGKNLLIFSLTAIGLVFSISIILFLQGVNREIWAFIKDVYLEISYRLVGF
ncbi:MAG TPA: YIP1 family protein [bacterium]|nr:YIP1 family protein [bacterium]